MNPLVLFVVVFLAVLFAGLILRYERVLIAQIKTLPLRMPSTRSTLRITGAVAILIAWLALLEATTWTGLAIVAMLVAKVVDPVLVLPIIAASRYLRRRDWRPGVCLGVLLGAGIVGFIGSEVVLGALQPTRNSSLRPTALHGSEPARRSPFVSRAERLRLASRGVAQLPEVEPEESVFWSEVVPAALRVENPIGALFSAVRETPLSEWEPEHDPFKDIAGTIYENYPEAFIYSGSAAETVRIMRKLEMELEFRQVLYSSGWRGEVGGPSLRDVPFPDSVRAFVAAAPVIVVAASLATFVGRLDVRRLRFGREGPR